MAQTFTVDQKTLLSILSSMQPICTKRTTMDITSFVLFQVGHKELVLKSTDLEISLQASCSLAESDFVENQSFLVSGRRIFDLVKELENSILFSLAHNQLSLHAGSVQLALNIKDAQEFPPFPERIENLMHFDANVLSELLDKVAFLIPQNNANPALNGLLLEISELGLKMTTTDGHCLAQVYSPANKLDQEKKWLLPRRAVFEIKKILESSETAHIFLGICNNQLVFSGESFNFFTKLLADQFPRYQSILERDGFIPASVDRNQLVKTLRRSACLLSGQFLATQFGFTKEKISVSLQNREVGKLNEELSLQGFEGSSLDIRFYAPYLLSGLQAFSDDSIKFYLKNATRPIIFESEHNGAQLTYLVMPVSPTSPTSH